eukprot:TRINITY_DN46000_c0_g1_i1.p1 TRINITY_DN46000_c0_g1~~TRINITY_DN46000_c0_g1_i1.p1  ORF type:complete len:108 (-),score=9.90 TRINITY_DN46000_c0_g1_i1:8-331(-)
MIRSPWLRRCPRSIVGTRCVTSTRAAFRAALRAGASQAYIWLLRAMDRLQHGRSIFTFAYACHRQLLPRSQASGSENDLEAKAATKLQSKLPLMMQQRSSHHRYHDC